MANPRFWTVFLLIASVLCLLISAQESEVASEDIVAANLEVTAEFPDNPFGLIVNGQRNKVVLTIANKEKTDYSVLAVSGKVTHAEDSSKILRNLTSLRYDLTIPAEGTVDVPYVFYSEFNPGELGLTVALDMFGGEKLFRLTGYSGIVTITDPETSWFDPQLIFMYVILAAAGLGVAYLIYAAFFDTGVKTKPKKTAQETAPPTHRDAKGNMVLDQSWIPDHHLQKGSPTQSPRVKKRSGRK
ncbi:hypothetical protein BCR43DRAFT_483303 [Syncephalastrum racemosum]|uniref:Uncharacterized protein n=1 Tax=Syncephalastrum racemosum TaxID=13706 RepID=A0A1X2HWD9_SYNRA|nr:hypothetical protein BCR43DRAFT_483303 [Syncephalastrum racemosum]